MTREGAKKWLSIIKAFAEGKIIQYKNKYKSEWVETDCPVWAEYTEYRIKPEPKYRPFQSQEECWNEMLKHQPFGWIKNNVGNIFNIIAMVNQNHAIKLNECYSSYRDIFKDFKFTDGTPFGIKEE